MASVDVWVSNQITLRFNWSQSSQSVANNNSVVSWNLQVVSSGGSISSSASKSWSVTVNGINYSGTNTVGVSTNATKTLASGSTTIGHNADGTKSFSFSFSQQFDINYSGVGWIGTKSGNGSGTLTTIPRASTVSSTSANIGENITITINRAGSSFTHTLTYAFCNLTGTIATKTSSTSLTFTLPTSFYAQIPNTKSSWGRVICDTYNGSTKIGSSECRFDVYVKESTNKPTLSPTVKDTNATTKALTGDENKFVKYYSNANFSFGASAKNSASISSYLIIAGGKTANSSSGTLSKVETGTFAFTVTDSRGFSTSSTLNKTLINYVKLTCSMTVSNPTADGKCTLVISGNYFNGSFGATSNTLTVKYKRGSTWYTATATKSGNTYTATVNLTGLDYTQSHTFQAQAIDKLATITTASKTVKSTPIFLWGEDYFKFNVSPHISYGSQLYLLNQDGTKKNAIHINTNNGNLDIGDLTKNMAFCAANQPTWWNGTDSRKIAYAEEDSGGYPCVRSNNSDWMRTPPAGICPYTSGTTGSIGTNTWRYQNGYIHNLYTQEIRSWDNTALGVTGKRDLWLTSGNGNTGIIWIQTPECLPAQNATAKLGRSDLRWNTIYAANGTIQTSDKRYKAVIDTIDTKDCFDMVKNTDIQSYVMLNNNKDEMTEIERIENTLMNSGNEESVSMGILAQDILQYDCSKYILVHDYNEDKTKDIYSVSNYALTSAIMGALKEEIKLREELQIKVNNLETENENLKMRLDKLESLLET